MAEFKPVFCMYDFRQKQQYIFRTKSVRECVGASALITWAYDGFLNRLISEKKWAIQKNYIFEKDMYLNEDAPFHPLDESEWGDARGRIIYVGGGSLYMMWRNRETAVEANRVLCALLREKTYSLSAVFGIADVTGEYSKDFRAVSADYEKVKAGAPAFMPAAMLPFSKVDRKTTLPVSAVVKLSEKEDPIPLSTESMLKHKQYKARFEIGSKPSGETTGFDEMIKEKGRESILAVIHIDGNNMGTRVKTIMNPMGKALDDYDTAVRRIRTFSNQIQEDYVNTPLEAVRQMISGLPDKSIRKFRTIITGGDDITLVCNARVALDLVNAYFKALNDTNKGRDPQDRNTACAGICIFHSHFPFSQAYDIAEECCASAKKQNRLHGGSHMLVDFQHCFGGATGNLEDMRANDNADLMRRPYRYEGTCTDPNSTTLYGLEDFIEAGKKLARLGRSNVKNLAQLNLSEKNLMRMELKRLEALKKISFTDEELEFLHDVAQMYDLWFAKEGA